VKFICSRQKFQNFQNFHLFSLDILSHLKNFHFDGWKFSGIFENFWAETYNTISIGHSRTKVYRVRERQQTI